MRRRQFLAATGAVLSPAVVRAQQVPPLIGVIRVNAKSSEQFEGGFRRDMARLGWEESRGYRTHYLWADGDTGRLPAMAAELVKAGAKVLVAFGNPGVAAAQAATRDMPIVAMADDLVAVGLVPSMARPGGNTTGLSIMGHELDVKRLEVLHEIDPQALRVGVVMDDNSALKGEVAKLEQAAAKLGLDPTIVHASRREQIAPAMASLAAARVESVQFLASPFLNGARATFIDQILTMKVPAMYEWPETVEEGGLVSYAPRISLCYRHVAVLVSKVLRGAKPADLPIEQPATFTLAVNTGTAHAIGLTLPEAIILRADVVVD
jgi:ABC-type uncharacterized transport system substrate-binding protein